MATQRGAACPVCGSPGSTKRGGLLPIKRAGRRLEPNQYAVCTNCYVDQWEMFYGKDEPCPVKREKINKRNRQRSDRLQQSSSTPPEDPQATL